MKFNLYRFNIIVVSMLALSLWNTSYAATIEDFVGVWKGNGTFVSGDETITESATAILSIDGNNLAGSLTSGKDSPVSISGTVANGIFSFDWPSSSPGDPDCANWHVSGTASINENLDTMTLELNGTFCGTGGGKPGAYSANLKKTKQMKNVSTPLLLFED